MQENLCNKYDIWNNPFRFSSYRRTVVWVNIHRNRLLCYDAILVCSRPDAFLGILLAVARKKDLSTLNGNCLKLFTGSSSFLLSLNRWLGDRCHHNRTILSRTTFFSQLLTPFLDALTHLSNLMPESQANLLRVSISTGLMEWHKNCLLLFPWRSRRSRQQKCWQESFWDPDKLSQCFNDRRKPSQNSWCWTPHFIRQHSNIIQLVVRRSSSKQNISWNGTFNKDSGWSGFQSKTLWKRGKNCPQRTCKIHFSSNTRGKYVHLPQIESLWSKNQCHP